MSDINVTVSSFPVQAYVTMVGVAGPQGESVVGPPGLDGTGALRAPGITGISVTGGLSVTGAFNIWAGSNINLLQSGYNFYISSPASSTNLNGLMSTGSADLRYLSTGSSGQFYLASNPSSFITNSNLVGLISTGSADTRYLVSGASGQFYLTTNPNNYIKSGEVIGVFYPVTNPNQYASSGYVQTVSGALNDKLIATGASLYSLINAVSGNTGYLSGYYPKSNPSNFSSSGNVENTGTSLQNQINGIKNGTGAFYQNSNPNNFIRSGDVNSISGSLQQSIERSGGYLYTLIGASSAGVSSLNSSSGTMTIVGAGNVSVTTAGQTITVSGNTGFLIGYYPVSNPERYLKSGEASNSSSSGLSTSGNVENTGTSLIGLIYGLSGQLNASGTLLATKYLGNPTDGSYGGTNGAIAGVAAGDIHEDAFDKIETILGKLAPAKPLNLSATTLTLLNTSYSAIEQGTSTTRTNVISSYFPTGRATGFYDGDAGILSGLVDSVATGIRVLSTGNDMGTYTGLIITADYDYYSGQAGRANFWTYLSATVSPSGRGLNSGQFTLQLKHSTSGPTNILTGYCDAPITPTLGIISVKTGTSTTTIIDGVPALTTSDQISVEYGLTGAVSSYYRSPISQISSSQTSSANVNTTGTPFSGSDLKLSGIVTVSASRYITGFIPTVVGYNSAGTSSSNATYNSNIRIDSASTQPSQRRTSSTGLHPQLGQFGATYSNNSLLTGAGNEELQLANGIIQYPFLVNYTGVVPAGPNYLNMPSGTYGNAGTGYRWACFNMGTVNDVSSLTLTYNTATNFGSSVINGGMMFQVRVSGATSTNGWLDGNGAYQGVGNPTNDGDLALVVGSSSATVKLITFGAAVKNGSVFARVGIPSGSSKSFASLTMS